MSALPGAGRQVAELARADVRVEVRRGEALLVSVSFGAVALLLVPLAVGTDTPVVSRVGPGMYWVVVLLFGSLLTARHADAGTVAHHDLLRLTIAPVVRLFGRVVANALLLLVFEALLGPAAVVLYDPKLAGWVWLAPLAVLVAFGLACLGWLAEELSAGLNAHLALGGLLVVPLAVPLLLAATQVPQAAGYGRAEWPWLVLAVAADLVTVVTCVLASVYVEEKA